MRLRYWAWVVLILAGIVLAVFSSSMLQLIVGIAMALTGVLGILATRHEERQKP